MSFRPYRTILKILKDRIKFPDQRISKFLKKIIFHLNIPTVGILTFPSLRILKIKNLNILINEILDSGNREWHGECLRSRVIVS